QKTPVGVVHAEQRLETLLQRGVSGTRLIEVNTPGFRGMYLPRRMENLGFIRFWRSHDVCSHAGARFSFDSVRKTRAVCPTTSEVSQLELAALLARIAVNGDTQPAAGVGPIVVGGGRGNAKRLSRLLDRHAREKAELDQFGLPPVELFKVRQCLIQSQ